MKQKSRTKFQNPGPLDRSASIPPETMMHFSPCFRFPPYFRKIFGLWGKFQKFYLFLKNFLIFIRQNFWWLLFSHRSQISNFPPIFAVSVHFPPVSRKLLFPPTLTNFPPVLHKFTCFTCISFAPYFYHDAFMHHPIHVLDAPACKKCWQQLLSTTWWRFQII